ncbi:BDH-like protein [Mya arenaria]|uniref:BDH-like protein n=1 Tax=Mya arenaria TaxID=6604 RepID=A0ABY7F8Z2_MYAAR|nr:BDH-like protein [Mya arenaria]
MSIGDLLPVSFFEVAFLATWLLLPVLVWRADVEAYVFGLIVIYMCIRTIRRRRRTLLPVTGKAVLVSGCDSGFGHMVAKKLDDLGYKVFAGCLSVDGPGAATLKESSSANFHIVHLDVTSDISVREVGQYVRDNIGDAKLWALVNNAGVYGHGDVELCSLETYQRLTDVNLFGMIRVTQELLPLLRQSQGRVVTMSSINGRFPWPSTSAYNATKYGLECVSDCLRLEMTKFGVRVALVEPAMFGGSTDIHSPQNETYTREYMRTQIDTIIHLKKRLNAKSPDAVIDAVVDAVSSSEPQYRYVVHGGPFQIDPLAVFGQIYPYLPEWLSDWMICRATGHNSLQMLGGDAFGHPGPESVGQKQE